MIPSTVTVPVPTWDDVSARCPICTQEFPDANAVRRHTLIEHGVSSAAEAGGWTPVSGPAGEPGWHPDPWNASSLRWWDGTGWSGKVAPIGAPPPPEAPPPRGPGWTSRTGLIAAVAGVVVVVIIAVVVFSGHPKPKAVVTQPTVTLAPVPTNPPATGGGGLASGVLAASDLPGGWTVKAAPAAMLAKEYTSGPCASPLWAHDVAGYSSVLADGGGSVLENAVIVSQVLESPTAGDTAAQAAYAMSPSFVDCAKAEVTAEAQDELAGEPGVEIGGVTADPLNLSLSTPNVGFVVDVSVVDPSVGVGTYVADDHIELFSGPYEGEVDIITLSTNPIADSLVQTEASAAAQRLQALPPGGTLHAGAV